MPATIGDLINSLNSPDLCGLEQVFLEFRPSRELAEDELVSWQNHDLRVCLNYSKHPRITPGGICSWRGSYRLASLVPGEGTVLVRDFAAMLKHSLEVSHQGWKGGDYWFDTSTDIWFSPEGSSHCIGVQGIEHRDGAVYVICQDEEY